MSTGHFSGMTWLGAYAHFSTDIHRHRRDDVFIFLYYGQGMPCPYIPYTRTFVHSFARTLVRISFLR